MLDNIPSFTKLNLAKIRAEKNKPVKPTTRQRRAMAAYLVRAGMSVYQACRSVKLSTRDYYLQKKALPK
jgi:hypothetical protein